MELGTEDHYYQEHQYEDDHHHAVLNGAYGDLEGIGGGGGTNADTAALAIGRQAAAAAARARRRAQRKAAAAAQQQHGKQGVVLGGGGGGSSGPIRTAGALRRQRMAKIQDFSLRYIVRCRLPMVDDEDEEEDGGAYSDGRSSSRSPSRSPRSGRRGTQIYSSRHGTGSNGGGGAKRGKRIGDGANNDDKANADSSTRLEEAITVAHLQQLMLHFYDTNITMDQLLRKEMKSMRVLAHDTKLMDTVKSKNGTEWQLNTAAMGIIKSSHRQSLGVSDDGGSMSRVGSMTSMLVGEEGTSSSHQHRKKSHATTNLEHPNTNTSDTLHRTVSAVSNTNANGIASATAILDEIAACGTKKYLNEEAFIKAMQSVLGPSVASASDCKGWFKRINFDNSGAVGWEDFSGFLLSLGEHRSHVDNRPFALGIKLYPTSCHPWNRHSSPITCCEAHPITGTLYTGGEDGLILAWDSKTLRNQTLVHRGNSWIVGLRLMNDGRLAAATVERELLIFDLKQNEMVKSYKGKYSLKGEEGISYAYSSGTTVAVNEKLIGHLTPKHAKVTSNRADNKEKYRRLQSGGATHVTMAKDEYALITKGAKEDRLNDTKQLEQATLLGLEEAPTCMDYHYSAVNQDLIFFGTRSGDVLIYDISNAHDRVIRLFYKLAIHKKRVNKVEVIPLLEAVLTCSDDCSLRLTSLETGAVLRDFSKDGHTMGVNTFVYSQVSKLIISVSGERRALVWDYLQEAPIYALEDHNAPLLAACVNEVDKQIMTLSSDNTVRISDLVTHKTLQTVTHRTGTRTTAAGVEMESVPHFATMYFDQYSHRHFVLSTYPQAYKLRQSEYTFPSHYSGHVEPVSHMTYSNIFRQLVTLDSSSCIVWDHGTGTSRFSFPYTVDFSPAIEEFKLTTVGYDVSQRRLLCGYHEGTVVVWNYNNGQAMNVIHDNQTEPMARYGSDVAAVCGTVIGDTAVYVYGVGRRLLYCPESQQYSIQRASSYLVPEAYGAVTSLGPLGNHLVAVGTSSGALIIYNLTLEAPDGRAMIASEYADEAFDGVGTNGANGPTSTSTSAMMLSAPNGMLSGTLTAFGGGGGLGEGLPNNANTSRGQSLDATGSAFGASREGIVVPSLGTTAVFGATNNTNATFNSNNVHHTDTPRMSLAMTPGATPRASMTLAGLAAAGLTSTSANAGGGNSPSQQQQQLQQQQHRVRSTSMAAGATSAEGNKRPFNVSPQTARAKAFQAELKKQNAITTSRVERIFIINKNELDAPLLLVIHNDGRAVLWHAAKRTFICSLLLSGAGGSSVSLFDMDPLSRDTLAYCDALGNITVMDVKYEPVSLLETLRKHTRNPTVAADVGQFINSANETIPSIENSKIRTVFRANHKQVTAVSVIPSAHSTAMANSKRSSFRRTKSNLGEQQHQEVGSSGINDATSLTPPTSPLNDGADNQPTKRGAASRRSMAASTKDAGMLDANANSTLAMSATMSPPPPSSSGARGGRRSTQTAAALKSVNRLASSTMNGEATNGGGVDSIVLSPIDDNDAFSKSINGNKSLLASNYAGNRGGNANGLGIGGLKATASTSGALGITGGPLLTTSTATGGGGASPGGRSQNNLTVSLVGGVGGAANTNGSSFMNRRGSATMAAGGNNTASGSTALNTHGANVYYESTIATSGADCLVRLWTIHGHCIGEYGMRRWSMDQELTWKSLKVDAAYEGVMDGAGGGGGINANRSVTSVVWGSTTNRQALMNGGGDDVISLTALGGGDGGVMTPPNAINSGASSPRSPSGAFINGINGGGGGNMMIMPPMTAPAGNASSFLPPITNSPRQQPPAQQLNPWDAKPRKPRPPPPPAAFHVPIKAPTANRNLATVKYLAPNHEAVDELLATGGGAGLGNAVVLDSEGISTPRSAFQRTDHSSTTEGIPLSPPRDGRAQARGCSTAPAGAPKPTGINPTTTHPITALKDLLTSSSPRPALANKAAAGLHSSSGRTADTAGGAASGLALGGSLNGAYSYSGIASSNGGGLIKPDYRRRRHGGGGAGAGTTSAAGGVGGPLGRIGGGGGVMMPDSATATDQFNGSTDDVATVMGGSGIIHQPMAHPPPPGNGANAGSGLFNSSASWTVAAGDGGTMVGTTADSPMKSVVGVGHANSEMGSSSASDIDELVAELGGITSNGGGGGFNKPLQLKSAVPTATSTSAAQPQQQRTGSITQEAFAAAIAAEKVEGTAAGGKRFVRYGVHAGSKQGRKSSNGGDDPSTIPTAAGTTDATTAHANSARAHPPRTVAQRKREEEYQRQLTLLALDGEAGVGTTTNGSVDSDENVASVLDYGSLPFRANTAVAIITEGGSQQQTVAAAASSVANASPPLPTITIAASSPPRSHLITAHLPIAASPRGPHTGGTDANVTTATGNGGFAVTSPIAGALPPNTAPPQLTPMVIALATFGNGSSAVGGGSTSALNPSLVIPTAAGGGTAVSSSHLMGVGASTTNNTSSNNPSMIGGVGAVSEKARAQQLAMNLVRTQKDRLAQYGVDESVKRSVEQRIRSSKQRADREANAGVGSGRYRGERVSAAEALRKRIADRDGIDGDGEGDGLDALLKQQGDDGTNGGAAGGNGGTPNTTSNLTNTTTSKPSHASSIDTILRLSSKMMVVKVDEVRPPERSMEAQEEARRGGRKVFGVRAAGQSSVPTFTAPGVGTKH